MPPKEHADFVAELFDATIECDTAERESFLNQRCGSDAQVRTEVESLLHAAKQAEGFMEGSAAELQRNRGAFAPGAVIASYEVVSLIAKGGMGEVYLARDFRVQRQVALKFVRGGLDHDVLTRRFRREQELLAALNHPNIAQLYDTGVTGDGVPYFVMEYVDGLRLDEFVEQRALDLPGRLTLFRKLCGAVAYAHQHLVIHRDIKPANIRVTAEGEPKLLDFGIGKLLDELAEDTAEQTVTMHRMLTPEYASPEQVRGQAITTASDVYSLGVVLYELLTGTKPYRLTNRRAEEISRAITKQEPTRPSENRESKFENSKSLRGDLDNIVLTALRKEPERRYASAGALSEDVRRYLEGLPVRARKDMVGYRASKFVRRHRVAVTAAVIVLIAIVSGLVAALHEARIAGEERNRAQAERAKAEQISEFLAGALSYSDPLARVPGSGNHRDATINEMLNEVAPRIETELANQADVKATLLRVIGSAFIPQNRFEEAERYLKQALETQLKLYGEQHLETAQTLLELATVFALKGDYPAAEREGRRALAVFRARPDLGAAHPDAFAATLSFMGDVLYSRGDVAGAEAVYRECVRLIPKLRNSPEAVGSAKRGLGLAYYTRGQLDEAAVLLHESAAEFRKQPHARWRVAEVLDHAGMVLAHSNKFDEALSALREGEEISRAILGEDSAILLRSLQFQAYTNCMKGDYEAAEATLSRAEAGYRRAFPADEVNAAGLADIRGLLLTRTGRAMEGDAFARAATEGYQKTLPRGANGITLARLHRAENLVAQKRFEEAERLLLEAYRDASEVQGARHLRARQAAGALAELYATLNRAAETDRFRALSE